MKRLKKILSLSKSFTPIDTLKNYLRLVFIWCPVVSALFLFGFSDLQDFPFSFSISMVIAVSVSSMCFVGSWLFRLVYFRWPRKPFKKQAEDSLFLGVLSSYPFLLPGLYLGFAAAGKFSAAIGRTYSPPSFRDYSSGVIFGIMVSGLFTLFEVIRRSKEAKHAADLKFQVLENEKLKAQVSALSAQMNPHLLFNSLNTIAATITTDPRSAEDMVVQLSELYRGILKSAKGDMHSLENELFLCKSYLEIEQKRFGSRVEYRIFVSDGVNPKKVQIPVLLLQPLVENSVKHGLSPRREGGRVSIEVKKDDSHLVIRIADNGVGARRQAASAKGTGTGLSNCEARIKLKYGEDSKFQFILSEKDETVAVIHIPWTGVMHD